ncbi:MAG: VCBS repeat-containing protein, partial [Phycisphaerales bacterium]|nr:VCBS repeat-containing protein [Phycisphaerales bacterium]
MRRTETSSFVILTLVVGLAGHACPAGEPWVTLTDETTLRLPVPINDPDVTTEDASEKSYAFADVDLDGDLDLIVARKQPWTSTGRRTNVLLMNEGIAEGHAMNGVLVDRTAEYASLSTVAGDLGFLTPTNDRDIIFADVDNDGDPDIITATALTDNEPSTLSHPRVYINLGHHDGVWLGFRYEDSRIPVMDEGTMGGPRFASVSAGDVTGDGFVDLFFTDFDAGGAQILDYNNRLLVNDGTGHFIDASLTAMGTAFNYGSFLGM